MAHKKVYLDQERQNLRSTKTIQVINNKVQPKNKLKEYMIKGPDKTIDPVRYFKEKNNSSKASITISATGTPTTTTWHIRGGKSYILIK